MKKLANAGVKFIAMRCAGFDRVDLKACEEHGIKLARVPTYSPTSVAEHALALLLALNRCVCRQAESGFGHPSLICSCAWRGGVHAADTILC